MRYLNLMVFFTKKFWTKYRNQILYYNNDIIIMRNEKFYRIYHIMKIKKQL